MYKVVMGARDAFNNNYNFNRGNDEVRVVNGKTKWYVYGNCIAVKNTSTGEVTHSTCGRNTKSTKDRLNAINVNCRIKNSILVYSDSLEPVNHKLIY